MFNVPHNFITSEAIQNFRTFIRSDVQTFNVPQNFITGEAIQNLRTFIRSDTRANIGYMKIERFEDLRIWQMASSLCSKIYKETKSVEWKYDTRFVQQIRAAAGSIMDNIAEGFERQGNKEFRNFLFIAKGSAGETRSQVIRAYNVGFIDKAKYEELYEDCLMLSSSINKFIQTLKFTEYKGTRYNDSLSSEGSDVQRTLKL